MKLTLPALAAAALLFCAVPVPAIAASGAPQLAPAQATPQAEPCLTGDPFDLRALAAAINDETPPTGPITINQHIIVQMVRQADMNGGEEDMATGDRPSGVGNPDERPGAPLDLAPLRVFNTATLYEFRVTFWEALLTAIHDCHERNGRTGPGGPADIGVREGQLLSFFPMIARHSAGPVRSGFAANPVAPGGWSDGVDTRILRTPTTLWPWRTLTNSSTGDTDTESNCSMTLIGPRHLVTAAHCLVSFGTSNWKTRLLTPGRDGQNVSPYGNSWMDPTPPPGESAWYIVPDAWLDPNTDDSGTEEYQWDIGAVLMLDRLGEQTGWMGYGAFPASDLSLRTQINRGYPECDKPEAPASCQSHRLYGDTDDCDVGSYHHPGSNGWNRNFSTDCDLGRGHSGSPLYHYRWIPSWQDDGPYVAAVVSWHECTTCGVDDDYPNHVRRITPWVAGWISWLKEQFP
jgi:V8-like Glu-specific endopeptidase